MKKVLCWLTIVLAVAAGLFTIGLLSSDMGFEIPKGIPPSFISAAPLFLIGVTFLIAQIILRPRWTDLLKNVLLAAAFILWSVVQLMEQSALSKKLGDVVIALYVFDLLWMILAGVIPAGATRSALKKTESSSVGLADYKKRRRDSSLRSE